MTDTAAVVVELDLAVYRLEAIKKAAYRFGARCFAQIDAVSATQVRVTLQPRIAGEDATHLAGEFRNEVLDQELREVVARETEAVRNLIMVQAFSKTSLLDQDGDLATSRRTHSASASPMRGRPRCPR